MRHPIFAVTRPAPYHQTTITTTTCTITTMIDILIVTTNMKYSVSVTTTTIVVTALLLLLLKPQNRNRQNRLIGIGIGDFDYSIMRSSCRIIIDKKMFVPRETQECQGPEAPSSFTHHGSISLPTQPVENYDWVL